MNKLKKIYLYCKNITKTGAIYETSFSAANEITKYIRKDTRQVIVELGSGTGSITKLILEKMNKESSLICFEINKDMTDYLQQEFDTGNMVIHQVSALDFTEQIDTAIDVVISSLPISFFKSNEMEKLLEDIKNNLKENGNFSQIVYNYFFKKKLQKKFSLVTQKTIYRNIPMAYVFHCTK